MLFLSSYSPEFSAIENLFGYLKNKLKDVRFTSKETLANKITMLSSEVKADRIQSF